MNITQPTPQEVSNHKDIGSLRQLAEMVGDHDLTHVPSSLMHRLADAIGFLQKENATLRGGLGRDIGSKAMFEIDRKRKTIWAIAPNGAKIDCGSVSRYLNAHLCEARYYALIRHETTEDGVLFTRIPDPGSEESKTPEAAFEALIKYLGLTENSNG